MSKKIVRRSVPDLPRFSAPRRKVARALRHIDELDRSIKAYFAGRWHTTTFDQAHGLRVRVAGTPADAEEALGDAIHNLRSALDLAAVEAVEFGGGSGNATHFPFCESAEHLEETIRRWKLHRAPAEVQDLIRNLKPYKGGNDALRGLHDLDIRDKHRTLIEVSTSVTTPTLRAVITDGRPRIEMDPTTETTAVFTFSRNSPFEGKSLVETLRDLGRRVSEIVDAIAEACKNARSEEAG